MWGRNFDWYQFRCAVQNFQPANIMRIHGLFWRTYKYCVKQIGIYLAGGRKHKKNRKLTWLHNAHHYKVLLYIYIYMSQLSRDSNGKLWPQFATPVWSLWEGSSLGRKWYQSKCRPNIPTRLHYGPILHRLATIRNAVDRQTARSE